MSQLPTHCAWRSLDGFSKSPTNHLWKSLSHLPLFGLKTLVWDEEGQRARETWNYGIQLKLFRNELLA